MTVMITRLAVFVAILFLSASGCMQSDSSPKPEEYIFNYTDCNSTTYYISEASVETVYVVHDTTTLEIMREGTAVSSTPEAELSNVVVVNRADTANPLQYNISSHVARGKRHVVIEFPASTDFVAYTEMLAGNELARPTSDGPVRVYLPEGYATGSLLLGTPRPSPEQRFEDDSGRTVLEWNGSNVSAFSVAYYNESAPMVLTVIFTILGGAGIVILTYFKLKITALQKKREMIERKGR